MKNSIRRNTTRPITASLITLLLVLAVSGVTDLLPHPNVEAVGSGQQNHVSGISSKPDDATRARVTEAFGKLPLRFEANQGQSDEKVKFLSRGSGYTLFLTSTEAVLSLRRPEQTGDMGSESDGETN